jgi:hypothetical protein
MRYLGSRTALAVPVCFLIVSSCLAQMRIQVIESGVRIQFYADRTLVILPVENHTREAIPSHVHLELVDHRGVVQSRSDQEVSVPVGTKKLDLSLPAAFAQNEASQRKNLLWYRLRYEISADPQSQPAKGAGIISVSEVTPDIFELHVVGPAIVREGEHYTTRIRAINPVSGGPVVGVAVQASLDLDADDDKALLAKRAITDRQGFALLEFTLPQAVDTDQIDVTVTGKLGTFSADAEGSFRVNHFSNVSVSTDKPIYQPGQILHTRLLAFGVNKKAIADQSVTVKILDPDETLVNRMELKTSRFGIAAGDWQIPDNLRLGTYRIEAKFGEGRYEDSGSSATVKISRYELPSFSVTVKPDRAYFLPDQDASIEIKAEYLLGEPVRHGRVRVVRETDRKWNYREQKWEIEEAETYEGEPDDRGRYIAKISLKKDHAHLSGNDYERFRDLIFAAYFTDSSTGRTEQRRFDVRVTKDPIHVYVIGSNGSAARGLPLEFYLSTDYADGTPVQCDVEIGWEAATRPSKDAYFATSSGQPLRRVRTNRYGVAKVSGLTIPADADSGNFILSFKARNHKGDVGHQTESMWLSGQFGVRVATDKTLYKPREPVEARISTSRPDTTVVVEVIHDFQVLASKLVRVRHGHATVSFEANDKFQNEVNILAYEFGLEPAADYYNSAIIGSHTVLFPKDHELKVNLKFAKSVYRPGDEATADLRITSANGEQAKSALGFVVVDKAVEERERTDREFGAQGGFYNFRNLWGEPLDLNGVQKKDLDKIDMAKPIPDGLELVAEALLQGSSASLSTFASDSSATELHKLFSSEIDPAILPIQAALNFRYEQKGEYPTTAASLESYLTAAGHRLQDARDPWGKSYRARFRVDREWDVLEIFSAGPDKAFGTDDDFVVTKLQWAYFKSKYEAIRRAVNEYHDRTGGFIRDEKVLKSELKRFEIDLDALKDRWGYGYQCTFGVDRTHFTVTISSAGPDGRFNTETTPSEDDFPLATVAIDYFAGTAAKFDVALSAYFKETQVFPEDLDQLKMAFEHSAVQWDGLRDAWVHPYYATFRQESRFSDDLAVETYEQYEGKDQKHLNVIPVTQQINWIYIRSAGQDGVEGTPDDFDVASFSRGVVEQSSKDKVPRPVRDQAVLAGATGAISGAVTDITGASITGAGVNAKNTVTEGIFTATTDREGAYLLRNLPAGFYVVHFSSPGFQSYATTNVPVRSSNVTQLNARLNVGTVNQTVEVSAAPVLLQTSLATLANVTKAGMSSLALPPQLSTPRLREYFPETLLWQPELVTDDKGHAQLKFTLADNITTWKLSAVASTLNGEMGTAEKDIRAFQPFFVEHEPPRFLTVGDEISLPVVLRNYLDRPLQLQVEMKPATWFSSIGSTTTKVDVSSRDISRNIFPFRASTAIKQGKQEISAIGADASDAISRSVTVRPNGEEKTVSASQVFDDATSLDLVIPDSALTGSVETTVKIYPNLTAHVVESIEAILQRPYGCGEQTISLTYPSILLLKYAKNSGFEKSPLVPRARRYAQLGYERLLSYRAPNGGFSYWGRGDGDLALTVYAIKFLSDASEFVVVDDSVIREEVSWVLNRIQPDGHWEARDWNSHVDIQRSIMLTAYIARVLASIKLATDDTGGNPRVAQSASAVVRRALTYLQPHVSELDEPYVISSYALAALDSGDSSEFEKSVQRLRHFEHKEGDSSYWSLELNTPFYGWGLAGRVETTALVLQTFARSPKLGGADNLESRGLLFLLRNQDRYGIWHSTQATINVLEAISALTSGEAQRSSKSGSSFAVATKAVVFVDGKQALSVDLPPGNVLSGPIDVDLSKFVSPGTRHIEIRRPTGSARASLQVLADYYVPWTQTSLEQDTHQEAKTSDVLRLSVRFDKQSAKVGEIVQCGVDVERIGFRGYGMLLAEIGLPPGAEVDRNSLDGAMKNSGWDINQYDVLPDKLIVYLWPHAGGTKFSFTFKPRYGLNALSAPSILYDYYNPEAHATVAPTKFTVQ